MLVGYYELNEKLQLRGPFQTEYEDFQNYWRHLPKEVHQLQVVNERRELWIWIRNRGWRRIK